MKSARIVTAARLHFGLFGWGPEALRQFGGFGLMIHRPGFDLRLSLDQSEKPTEENETNTEIMLLADSIRKNLNQAGKVVPDFNLEAHSSIPSHHGMGSGTQRALAAAELLALFAGCRDMKLHELADLAGRHPRSGVGAYGYFNGGLVVDGGHKTGLGHHRELAPTLCRLQWPEYWKVVLVVPQEAAGAHGDHENKAFAKLPAPPLKSMDLVSRTTLTAFLPAVAEADFISAMASLETVQQEVGGWFAPAQHNSIFGSPARDRLVKSMKNKGLRGVGQSSWGPTLFGFSQLTDLQIHDILQQVQLDCPEISFQSIITEANNTGRRLEIQF